MVAGGVDGQEAAAEVVAEGVLPTGLVDIGLKGLPLGGVVGGGAIQHLCGYMIVGGGVVAVGNAAVYQCRNCLVAGFLFGFGMGCGDRDSLNFECECDIIIRGWDRCLMILDMVVQRFGL